MMGRVLAAVLVALAAAGCARSPSPEEAWVGHDFYPLELVDQLPVLRSCRNSAQGPYDPRARIVTVSVDFDVTRQGQVTNPRISYARSGAPRNLAISIVMSCFFDPGRINGVPVNVKGMSLVLRLPGRR